MGVTDTFPLQNGYPVDRSLYDRKVRVLMPNGDTRIRSRGPDRKVFDLVGWGSPADFQTLIDFYEAQATDVFAWTDNSFSPARDRVVRFAAAPRWDESFAEMIWRCTLREAD
jgi:hypothetical protein